MHRAPSELTEVRLALLYDAEGFGGETTMRAKVIRKLIDEIRLLRSELIDAETRPEGPMRPANVCEPPGEGKLAKRAGGPYRLFERRARQRRSRSWVGLLLLLFFLGYD